MSLMCARACFSRLPVPDTCRSFVIIYPFIKMKLHLSSRIRSLLSCGNRTQNLISSRHRVISSIYYMEESVLLGTKPLVDSIRHFIRDPSGVFSVCHLCECRIVQ